MRRRGLRPGVLDGGVGHISGSAHCDAEPARGRQIDGRVSRTGAHQEPNVGQLLQHLGRELCALAHGYQYIEAGEAADNVVSVSERLSEDHDIGVRESQSAKRVATFW